MSDATFQLPGTIGPFRVHRALGQGGMAAVYEVEDPVTRERVALKLLSHRGLAMPRFTREFKVLTRLDHPHIVRVYSFGMHDGAPYLTMELLDGVPVQVWAKALGRAGLPERTREVMRATAQVADALEYLHNRGVVHRDLKSANVLIQRDGNAKLLDFGTARLGYMDELTRHGEFVGTFAYASPEQISGGTVDARSDLYSLGVLLYRLSTGRQVFEADNPHALARMHMEKEPLPPRRLVPALPEELEQIILQLLAKDPADRIPSARSVADRLRGGTGKLETGLQVVPPYRLVGREEELATVQAALSRAIKPARTFLITGAHGSGRRKMLSACAAEARGRSCRVFEASFTGRHGPDALGEAVHTAWGTLEPTIQDGLRGEAVRAREGGAERAPTALAMIRILEARAAADGKPVVLSLFDVDLAAPEGLDLLARLRNLAKARAIPLVFLLSATDEADLPGGDLRTRFPDAWRLVMRPLTVEEVAVQVKLMVGLTPPAEITRRLHEVTGGQPAFVEEVVRAMVQEGLVTRERGFSDRAGRRMRMPRSGREAVEVRLEGLPRDALRVMEALAVAGGRATTRELAYALERPEEWVGEVLDGLVGRRLLGPRDENGEEAWTFRLPLVRDIVGERLRLSRRWVLRRRCAQALEARPASAQKVLLLAASGQAAAAIEQAVAWAEPLLDKGQGLTVLPVLQAVVGGVGAVLLGDYLYLDREITARSFLLLGRAMMDVRPGDPAGEEALRRADSWTEDPILKAEIELVHQRLLANRGDFTGARERLNRAAGILAHSGSDPLKVRLHNELGAMDWYRGRYFEAQRQLESAVRHARRLKDEGLLGNALVTLGVTVQVQGHLREAEGAYTEAMHLFETVGDRPSSWFALANHAEMLRLSARWSEALDLLEPEVGPARESGLAERWGHLSVSLAEVEIEIYRLGRARERLAELLAQLDPRQHLVLRLAAGIAQGRLALAANDPMEVIAILGPVIAECNRKRLAAMAAQARALLGRAQAISGQRAEAADTLELALDALARSGNIPALAEACAARARAFGAEGDPEAIFSRVRTYMDEEPCRLVRMEYLLASSRRSGDATAARALLEEVESLQSPEVRDAMKLHPWSLALRRGAV